MTGTMIVCACTDEGLVSTVEQVLRDGHGEWDVRCVRTAAEAADLLAAAPVEALVTEPDMPGLDAASLLEYTHAHFPAVARLVLSGQGDGDVRIDGVGAAAQALSKPCTPDTLEAAVELVLQLRHLVESESLRALFGAQDALAKPPHIYGQLVALGEDPNSTTDDVVALVQQDVGLAAEMLRLVNSAFYGQAGQVTSIQWAVVLLGLETLKALAVAGVVFRPGLPLPPGLDSTDLAARAVRASMTAQRVARREGWDERTAADVALSALLAEVGLLVLAPARPDQWEELREREQHVPAAQAQREVFGCTVGEASAYLLGLWGFPAGAVATTAAHPLDVADADALAAATPTAVAVAFAHRKALGMAEEHLFARSGYLDDHRLARWLSA